MKYLVMKPNPHPITKMMLLMKPNPHLKPEPHHNIEQLNRREILRNSWNINKSHCLTSSRSMLFYLATHTEALDRKKNIHFNSMTWFSKNIIKYHFHSYIWNYLTIMQNEVYKWGMIKWYKFVIVYVLYREVWLWW